MNGGCWALVCCVSVAVCLHTSASQPYTPLWCCLSDRCVSSVLVGGGGAEVGTFWHTWSRGYIADLFELDQWEPDPAATQTHSRVSNDLMFRSSVKPRIFKSANLEKETLSELCILKCLNCSSAVVSNSKQHLNYNQDPGVQQIITNTESASNCAHLWFGPMGGCTGIPDFRVPLSLSASLLPPGSPSLGTELARLELWWRSEWSSLRLRRILPCGSLMLLLRQSRLITFWDTVSSKRCRCFLGMKILANIVACDVS